MATLGDARRSDADRRDVVDKFKFRNDGADKSECCVPFGVRNWWRRGVDELLSPKFQVTTFRWASVCLRDGNTRHAGS